MFLSIFVFSFLRDPVTDDVMYIIVIGRYTNSRIALIWAVQADLGFFFVRRSNVIIRVHERQQNSIYYIYLPISILYCIIVYVFASSNRFSMNKWLDTNVFGNLGIKPIMSRRRPYVCIHNVRGYVTRIFYTAYVLCAERFDVEL